jgi:hypothetical protein
MVVSDERSDADLVAVAAAEVRDADEFEEVILVARALVGIAADEVFIGPDGEAQVVGGCRYRAAALA